MTAIPDRVDAIILGTGLVNSILAAACSRIGKSVLHLDENGYYGTDWASFTFQQLVDWIKSRHPDDASLRSIPDELTSKSRLFCLDLAPRFLYSDGRMVDLLVKSNVARYHEFKNNIRILCCIGRNDIHVMPCRRNEVFTSPLLPNLADKRRLMKFIETCVSSESAETDRDGELVALSEKPIGLHLQERGLSASLREYIINSIAMVDPEVSTREACKRIKRFMQATERFGRSPFLFPLYGCGEFPQSFCRLSAVFGGLYCLNTQIKSVEVPAGGDELESEAERERECERTDKHKSEQHQGTGEPRRRSLKNSERADKFKVTFSDDEHTVRSDVLVVEPSSIASVRSAVLSEYLEPTDGQRHLSRAILITRKSVVEPAGETCAATEATGAAATPGGQDLISFMRIPPSHTNTHLAFLVELNSSALVCPKDYSVVYLWTRAHSDEPRADLEATVERVFKGDTSCVAWSFYYRQRSSCAPLEQVVVGAAAAAGDDNKPPSARPPEGLFVTGPASDDIDYDSAVREAEQLFARICPGEEFLPRAPDPEEIVSV